MHREGHARRVQAGEAGPGAAVCVADAVDDHVPLPFPAPEGRVLDVAS
ncbi:hypothetical protein Cus16_0754 [Curtobacterium sp. ER1/6]|nr:hypothetical protein Cus16_0754 [Curtobacterium sp. ER1/6]